MTVRLVPLSTEDRERFILDNQWTFKHGAMIEFGERNADLNEDGEIISRKTIEDSIDAPDNMTYRIVSDDRIVGGAILKIDGIYNHNHLEILFILPEEHGKGLGYAAWKEIERTYPETEIWETCTPYFEKRNIHFYVNKCGFAIDQFWCEHFQPEHGPSENDEGPTEMFRLKKIM